MTSLIRPTLVLLLILTAITGVLYPLAITGISAVVFPGQAAGSLVYDQAGKAIGSTLIGQSFSDPGHFWSRPSATSARPYNGIASGGSNQGPLNPALTDAIRIRIRTLQAADPDNHEPIPVDLVTASGSGLDPEISIAAANYQADRVARARKLNPKVVKALIQAHARGRVFGLLGEPRVNVLELNLALDAP